jgi:hypothetical protein
MVRDLLLRARHGRQVAYHLLAQAGAVRAPWPITTIVSCLPVLVLGMGTAVAHMLRADAASADMKDSQTPGPGDPGWPRDWSPDQPGGDQRGPDRARTMVRTQGPVPPSAPGSPRCGDQAPVRITAPKQQNAPPQMDQARLIARTLAAPGNR